jgi:hypothetical protein
LSLPVSKVIDTIERMAEAVTETRTGISSYLKDHPEFSVIGERMLVAWNEGVKGLIKGPNPR